MKYYALVGVFFIVAYLLPLAGRPMVTPDEFRYAEIPREMIDRGDYVTPHLVNMRYFEKPVMGYWMTAGCFKVFGENAFALRLPAALGAGLAALLAALLIQQTLHDEKIAALAARLYVTVGQFSTVRLERGAQLAVQSGGYCMPTRECCDDEGCEEDPCELFSRVDFPVRAFYPEGSDCGGTSCCGSCGK